MSDIETETPINVRSLYELVQQLDAKMDILLEQNGWLGSNVVPALMGIDEKVSTISAEVRQFVAFVSTMKLPGFMKGKVTSDD